MLLYTGWITIFLFTLCNHYVTTFTKYGAFQKVLNNQKIWSKLNFHR